MYKRIDPSVFLTKNFTQEEQEEMDITFEYLSMCKQLNKPIESMNIQDMKAQLEEYKKR